MSETNPQRSVTAHGKTADSPRRAASADAPQEVAKWWERFQEANADEREGMLVAEEAGPKKKRRRRRKRKHREGAPAAPGDEGPA